MDPKKVLLLNSPTGFAEAISPSLTRKGFEIDRLRPSATVLELVARVKFHLIAIGTPLTGVALDELIRTIRKANSSSRTASVLLVGSAGTDPEIAKLLGNGANAFVEWPGASAGIIETLSRFVEVSPRKELRLMLKIRATFGATRKLVVCQSENLSRTGLLLRVGGEPLPIGTELDLEFTLPGDTETILIRGKVVRHTLRGKEKVQGLGVRFEDLSPLALGKLSSFFDH